MVHIIYILYNTFKIMLALRQLSVMVDQLRPILERHDHHHTADGAPPLWHLLHEVDHVMEQTRGQAPALYDPVCWRELLGHGEDGDETHGHHALLRTHTFEIALIAWLPGRPASVSGLFKVLTGSLKERVALPDGTVSEQEWTSDHPAGYAEGRPLGWPQMTSATTHDDPTTFSVHIYEIHKDG